ncbi:MAG: type II secretion system protein, partial [Desulfobacteraceae bacterium]
MDKTTINSGVTCVTPQQKELSEQFSPAGCSSGKIARAGGFTLIELIVVMSLIGIMLGFAAPQLRSTLFVDGTKKVSRWLMLSIPAVKTKALREQKIMILGVSIDQDKVWVVDQQEGLEDEQEVESETDEDEDDEDEEIEKEPEKPKIFEFPSDVHIMDVEFPEQDRISVGETEIYFYPRGHSDHA